MRGTNVEFIVVAAEPVEEEVSVDLWSQSIEYLLRCSCMFAN